MEIKMRDSLMTVFFQWRYFVLSFFDKIFDF